MSKQKPPSKTFTNKSYWLYYYSVLGKCNNSYKAITIFMDNPLVSIFIAQLNAHMSYWLQICLCSRFVLI